MMTVLCSAESDSSPPITGILRLTGPRAPREGILEVYHDGIWGTVCGNDFGDNEASVACYSMGYGSVSYKFYYQFSPYLFRICPWHLYLFLTRLLSYLSRRVIEV